MTNANGASAPQALRRPASAAGLRERVQQRPVGILTDLQHATSQPDLQGRPSSVPAGGRPGSSNGRPSERKKLMDAERAARWNSFLERQRTATVQIRQSISSVQRGIMQELQTVDGAGDLARQGARGFKELLKRRFGTVTAAWRVFLNRDGSGRLGFCEFCQVCRDMGYGGNVKALWTELDTDEGGFISLDELDHEAAVALGTFRKYLIAKFGGTLQGWHFLDVDKNHRLDAHEFEERLSAMQFEGDAMKLFKYLQTDLGRPYLTLHDLDANAHAASQRGDTDMLTFRDKMHKETFVLSRPNAASTSPAGIHRSETRPIPAGGSPNDKAVGTRTVQVTVEEEEEDALTECESDSDAAQTGRGGQDQPSLKDHTKRRASTGTSRWVKELSRKHIELMKAQKEKRKQADKGVFCCEGLKRLLVRRYGSIYTGWRNALDLDGNGRLSFNEFCAALRELGFNGNVKELWHFLDEENSGFIDLHNICPLVHEALTSYREVVLSKWHNMLQVWMEGLDPQRRGQIDQGTFVEHCKAVGWEGDGAFLFKQLKLDHGRKFLTLRDYDTGAWSAMIRGDMGMVSEDQSYREAVADMDFYERQETTFHQRWAKVQAKNKNVGMVDKDSLKDLIVKRFGTPTAAWRHLAANDRDGKGKMAFGEFCVALRRIGYCGNLKEIWADLDREKKGFITLKEFDPHAHEVVTSFRDRLTRRYGSMMKGWKELLDTNRNGCLEEVELKEACVALGWKGDVHELFHFLMPHPGCKYITMADLDPMAMAAYYRGDTRAMLNEGPDTVLSDGTKGRRTSVGLVRSTTASKWSQSLGKSTRDKVANHAKERDARRMGATTLQGFKKVLIQRFGSIVAAWREILDKDGNGRLSFGELAEGARLANFAGDVRALMRELDTTKTGLVTLEELDPESWQVLVSFRSFLVDKFGGLEYAWEECFDKDGQVRLDLPMFLLRCDECGYEVDNQKTRKMLFKYLIKEKSKRVIFKSDFQAMLIGLPTAERTAVWRGREYAATPMDPASPHCCSPNASSRERRLLGLKEREFLQRSVAEEKARRMGSVTFEDLKRDLLERYGTIVCAWRKGLDTDGNGRLSFGELCDALRLHSFIGDMRGLWKSLDVDNSGLISLDEFDPESAKLIGDFRSHLCSKYPGGLYQAWHQGFDPGRQVRLEEKDWCKACRERCGWDAGGPKQLSRLFKTFIPEKGKKFIVEKDFKEVLYIGLINNNEKLLCWRGSELAAEETEEGKQHVKTTLAQRERALIGHAQRNEHKTRKEADNAKVMGATNVEEFKQALTLRFGNIVAAWKKVLDTDGNGRLSFGEFMTALRSLGFAGNAKELWNAFDPEKTGLVSLEMIDPDAWELLGLFRGHLLRTFGGLFHAWHAGFDPGRKIKIMEDDFTQLCLDSGFEASKKELSKLFKYLVADKSRKHMIIADFETMLIGVSTADRRYIWSSDGATASDIKRSMTTMSRSLTPSTPGMSRQATPNSANGPLSPKSPLVKKSFSTNSLSTTAKTIAPTSSPKCFGRLNAAMEAAAAQGGPPADSGDAGARESSSSPTAALGGDGKAEAQKPADEQKEAPPAENPQEKSEAKPAVKPRQGREEKKDTAPEAVAEQPQPAAPAVQMDLPEEREPTEAGSGFEEDPRENLGETGADPNCSNVAVAADAP
eukprot:TRINITY_DN8590_c0_g1_i1.p1 TRINITY_DN8590_c0_g1~~TRINITY_DN8590_c0_g1_i1.p1  ORF type:complete len:1661 (-),score=510.83 TRINITY_DN8590_c0_g1_i1:48-5030(-)